MAGWLTHIYFLTLKVTVSLKHSTLKGKKTGNASKTYLQKNILFFISIESMMDTKPVGVYNSAVNECMYIATPF